MCTTLDDATLDETLTQLSQNTEHRGAGGGGAWAVPTTLSGMAEVRARHT